MWRQRTLLGRRYSSDETNCSRAKMEQSDGSGGSRSKTWQGKDSGKGNEPVGNVLQGSRGC